MKDLEIITDAIECTYSQMRDTKSLCGVIYEKVDHADGGKPMLTFAEYDTLRDLISILYERLYDETMNLKSLIERIYKEEPKENGKV